MRHLRNLGNRVSVPIRPDADGYMGRECPKCEGYFKTVSGTVYKGNHLPCHCPYCGHTAGHDHFWTKEQIEYAKSQVIRTVHRAFQDDLREMASKSKFMTFKPGTLPSIRHYREKQLETEVVCDHCTLKYTIYGVFAFCPDCRTHNSLQILSKNLDLAEKQVDFAAQAGGEFADHFTADALENAVASFDGFGREACRVNAVKATDPAKAEKMSFQNPAGARTNFQQLFGKDFAQTVDAADWAFINQCAQKRHLLAHNMGVVDQHYLTKTNDPTAVEGRKVQITGAEVKRLAACLRRLGQELIGSL